MAGATCVTISIVLNNPFTFTGQQVTGTFVIGPPSPSSPPANFSTNLTNTTSHTLTGITVLPGNSATASHGQLRLQVIIRSPAQNTVASIQGRSGRGCPDADQLLFIDQGSFAQGRNKLAIPVARNVLIADVKAGLPGRERG